MQQGIDAPFAATADVIGGGDDISGERVGAQPLTYYQTVLFRSYTAPFGLFIMLLLGVVAWVGLTKGVDWVSDQFQGPDDYPGTGRGSVEFTVNEGDTTVVLGASGSGKSVTSFSILGLLSHPGRVTGGRIQAVVSTKVLGRDFTHTFALVVPGLDNYRHFLLRVRHSIEVLDTPATRGMLHKVRHLVKVGE